MIDRFTVGTWIFVERDPRPPIECIITAQARQCMTVAGMGHVQMTDEGLLFYDPSNTTSSWFISPGRQGRIQPIDRVRTSR